MAEGSRSSSSGSRGRPSTGKPSSRKPPTGSRGKPSSRKPSSGKPTDSRGKPTGSSRGTGSRSSRGGSSRRPSAPKKPVAPARAEQSGWGSVAQHGAAGATLGQRADEAEGPRSFSPEETRKFEQRQARRQKEADRINGLRLEAKAAIDRSGVGAPTTSRGSKVTVERRPLPSRPPRQKDARKELIRILGERNGDRAWKAYRRAAKEFEADRCSDAKVTLRPVVQRVPEIVDLRELYGLILYRLGMWEEAIDDLEYFRTHSGTAEQHPVLMDTHRALEHWADVDELWNELREASPSSALVNEGRIVRAGVEADRGDLRAAVQILEKGWKLPSKPLEHHLRRAYALADLYERSGNLAKSRALFDWIEQRDPHFGDVEERARNLD